MAKSLKSYNLTPPHLQEHVMSMKCEEPIDEQSKFGNFVITQTLNTHVQCIALCKRDGITDRRTNRRTIWLLDAPCGPFRPGHDKMCLLNRNARGGNIVKTSTFSTKIMVNVTLSLILVSFGRVSLVKYALPNIKSLFLTVYKVKVFFSQAHHQETRPPPFDSGGGS